VLFQITDLPDKVMGPDLDIPLEDMITIFRGPQDMGGRPGYRVDRPSLPVSSSTDIEKCAATVTNGLNQILKKRLSPFTQRLIPYSHLFIVVENAVYVLCR